MLQPVDLDSHTPRAPNKAFKAAIPDLSRYRESQGKGREPCTFRNLAMSQNCNPAGPKTHRKFSYTPGNHHRRGLFRYSRIPHLIPSTNPTTAQANHLWSVWAFSPMVGGTDSQDKRISHAPLFDGVLRGRESHPPSQMLRRDRVSQEVEIPDAWVHTEAWKTSFQ